MEVGGWELCQLSDSHSLFADELTVDCVPWNVTSRLERACHLLALSRDCGMALDDPLWASLPDCTPPPRQVGGAFINQGV